MSTTASWTGRPRSPRSGGLACLHGPLVGWKATLDKGVLHITGKFDIARKDADLGQESDPGGDYVSLKIGVDINVTAKAPP